MKIIVLHGDDSEKSYSRLVKFINVAKKRNWEIVNDKIEDTASLFGNEKLIIIRDYKSLGKSEFNLIDRIAGFLVVFHKGVLPAAFLKSLPKDTKIEKYDLPVILWKFLDSWDIKLFHKLLKTNAVEYIFAMIAWKLKQKYIKNPSSQNAKLISELAEIDVKAKTSIVDLKLALELFLLKNLIP
jgi:hypothetical protein